MFCTLAAVIVLVLREMPKIAACPLFSLRELLGISGAAGDDC